MRRLSVHSRNHSFPPSVRYVQSASGTLNQPLPDIDDEPWVHFLASSDDDDEQYTDYLHFDAGILAGSEANKRKSNKFRPFSTDTDRAVKHHHGAFHRRQLEHGFVHRQPESTRYSLSDKHDLTSSGGSYSSTQSKPMRRPGKRTHSGHRHSWQEPSLFTVAEEVPRIVISDFDDDNVSVDYSTSTDDLGESCSPPESTHTIEIAVQHDRAPESPRMGASIAPAEKSDAQLNRMWLAERARL